MEEKGKLLSVLGNIEVIIGLKFLPDMGKDIYGKYVCYKFYHIQEGDVNVK